VETTFRISEENGNNCKGLLSKCQQTRLPFLERPLPVTAVKTRSESLSCSDLTWEVNRQLVTSEAQDLSQGSLYEVCSGPSGGRRQVYWKRRQICHLGKFRPLRCLLLLLGKLMEKIGKNSAKGNTKYYEFLKYKTRFDGRCSKL
jgi:hypothetical protein